MKFNSQRRSGRSTLRRGTARRAFEPLEGRQMLAADPIITEFMASNGDTLDDGNDASSDWIEIYNAGDAALDLAGWHLTDDPADLDRWRFPSHMLAPGEYLTVFASGNDAPDPAGNLHTDFQLSAEGEFVALVHPDGTTVASQFAPAYPPQYRDVSYGIAMNATEAALLTSGAAAQVLIPTSGDLGATWTTQDFVPGTDWITQTSPGAPAAIGVGFETQLSTPNLAAAWSLDDDVGSTTAFDATDNGHNGATFGGVTFGATGATANTGGAAALTGSGVINVPYSAEVNPNSFTVTLWARVTGGSGFRSAITSRYDGLVFGGGNLDGYILYAGSDNRWQFWTGDGESAIDGWDVLAGPSVVANEWTHLAISFDAATSTKRMYVNGALAASTTAQGYAPVTNAARTLHLGGGGDDGNSFRFVGNLDDVGLFSAVLDSATIQQIMAGGVPQTGTDIISPEVHTDLAAEMLGTNATAYIRVPFHVDSPEAFDGLWLRMKYDDGFVAYLNGHVVASRNAPAGASWNSAATGSRPDTDSIEFEEINISSALPHLAPGENVLAIHGLNLAVADGDFLISPELIAVSTEVDAGNIGYFTAPTPNDANSSATSAVPPAIAAVTHAPNVPTASQPVVVTAEIVRTTHPIADVTLHYRVMFGAEVGVPMSDDGAGSDAVAGDGKYTGIIPAGVAAAGQMLRYYVTAEDTAANVQRAPRADDTTGTDQDPQYFGTVVQNPAVTSQIPIFQWFATNPVAGHSRGGVRASVFYNGEFYDNIFVRQRGQATNSSVSQKFDFNEDHLFFVNDTVGRVEEINLNAQGADPTYLRQTLAFETWRDVGVPAGESFLLRMQVNGQFDRVGIYAEQVDDRFVSRQGLDPEGALYKFVQRSNLNPVFSDITTGIEKKTRLDEDFSDIQAVIAGLALPTREARRNFILDNFDVPELINYLAVRAVVQDADDIRKNFYLYRDTNGDREWSIFPWDKDYTFGVRGDGGPHLDHPFFGAQEHPKLNANQWNVLFDVVFDIPETQAMYLRRLRTLMDERLKPAGTPAEQLVFEKRLDELFAQAATDLALHGVTAATVNGIKPFFDEQRNDFFNTHSIDNAGGPGIVGTLIPEFAAGARWFVPNSDSLGLTWTQPGFADGGWNLGQMGIGFENTPADYASLIRTSVNPTRGNAQGPLVTCSACTSTFVRIPFTIADEQALADIAANGMTLRMKYDDGFVAFINGIEVARRNVPGAAGTPVAFNAAATNHDDAAAVVFENINITPFASQLVVGTNVLAIQGVNAGAGSSDMLILPELAEGAPAADDVAGIPHAQPAHPTILFGAIDVNPVSHNQDEEYIELANPNDFAVDISGWKLAGGVTHSFTPGTVIPAGDSLYVSPNAVAFRARTSGPRGGQGLFIQGGYNGHLSNFGETIELLAADESVIASTTTPSNPSDVQKFLRVTEFMYHPANPSGEELDAGHGDGDLFEFIELVNTSPTTSLDLTDVAFTGGIEYTFGALTAQPGEHLVLVSNLPAFRMRYGDGIAVAGQYVGNLSNGGEPIKLDDVDGSSIQDFTYDDNGPGWFPSTDGEGFSLAILDAGAPLDSWSDPAAWRASFVSGGTPGEPEPALLPGDMNGDLRVDLLDLALVQSHFGISSGATRAEGDLDGDGAIGRGDAAAVARNFGRDVSNPAPGPSAVLHVAKAAATLVAAKVRREPRRADVTGRSSAGMLSVDAALTAPLDSEATSLRIARSARRAGASAFRSPD